VEKIRERLVKNQIILLVLPSSAYGENIMQIVEQFDNKKLLYVTLNTPYNSLVAQYAENKVKINNCFFIDGISASNNINIKADNCIFIASPQALTQLSLAIIRTIKIFEPEMVIFDSLSTLLIYLPEKSIIAFQQSLSTKLRGMGAKALFPILENQELINNISLFVDECVWWEQKSSGFSKIKADLEKNIKNG